MRLAHDISVSTVIPSSFKYCFIISIISKVLYYIDLQLSITNCIYSFKIQYIISNQFLKSLTQNACYEVYTHTHTHTHRDTYIYVCVCVCVFVCVCVCV